MDDAEKGVCNKGHTKKLVPAKNLNYCDSQNGKLLQAWQERASSVE